MIRRLCAALIAAFTLAAAAGAQTYDLFVIEDPTFGASVNAASAPNGRWAGIRRDAEGAEFVSGDVLAAAPEDGGDGALAFARNGDSVDLVQSPGDARTFIRIDDASAADARDFVAGISGASSALKQQMRDALGL